MAKIPNSIMNTISSYLFKVGMAKRIMVAYLYGSYAKGSTRSGSDIDLAIVSADFIGDMFEERLELMRLAAITDDRIEPHPFLPQDFNDSQPLVNEIRRTGIILTIPKADPLKAKRKTVGSEKRERAR